MMPTALARRNTRKGSGSSFSHCTSRAFRLTFAVLLFAAARLRAQAIGGQVTEADSRQPVAAALIQLLPDSSESILASTSTGEQGRFSFPARALTRFRVRILRIGFRPWTSEPLVASAVKVGELSFAIPAVPVVLTEITVETRSQCRGSPAEDQRLALLWDDARTALALLDAGTAEKMLEFRSTVTKRVVDPGDHLVSVTSMLSFGRGAWPVASQPAETLAVLGFVQPRDTLFGPTYFGPDVAVFFSDAFIQTHCFKLVANPDPGVLGLGFEPVKDRKVPDIEGVLWVDREKNRLRKLEYRYTSLWKWVPKGSAGGRLEFAFLADGRPVLTGWSIRAPVARIEDWPEGVRVRDESTKPFFGSGRVVLHGFREETGEVRDIRQSSGTVIWSNPASSDSTSRTRIPSGGAQRP